MTIQRRTLLALMLTTGLTPAFALVEGTIKIGVLATFEGPFTVLGEDGLRGATVAVDEAGGWLPVKPLKSCAGHPMPRPIAPCAPRANWSNRTA